MRELSQADKLFFFERSFFTLDGLWMIEVEKVTNWETALNIDLTVWKNVLKIVIRRLKAYLNLVGNDLNALVNILTFRWSIEGWGYKVLKREQDKVKIVVNQCPYKGTMDRNPERTEKLPLICRDMCIPLYKSVSKEFNKNVTLFRPLSMGIGDDYCEFSFSYEETAKDDNILGDLTKNARKISKEDKLFYFEKTFRTLDGMWMIESEKEFGWDTALKLDIIVWQKLYKITFRRVKKYLKISGNTLEDLVNILSFIWNCEGNIHDIIEVGENKFTISIVECPYIEAMKRNPERHNKIESICKEMCVSYLRPVINEFNPEIEITRDKFIGLGDVTCNIILSLKE